MRSDHTINFDEALYAFERAEEALSDAATEFVIQETMRLSRRWPNRNVTLVSCHGQIVIFVSTKIRVHKDLVMHKSYMFDPWGKGLHGREIQALNWLDRLIDSSNRGIPVHTVRIEFNNGIITQKDYEW